MVIVDLLGAVLTVLTLGFLLLGGYLLALRCLGGEAARRDPLVLAIATLLLATAEAVGIGLFLGAFGLLRIGPALGLQAALTLILLLPYRKTPQAGGLEAPAAEILRRLWAHLRQHPVLALLAAHAAGSEALRGLLRPPLSWDSLMYHLLLSGNWLRHGDLAPVFGNIPINYYGYVPANGSVWFWWWMAPSHSELYVNLASLPHWALLGLACFGVARELGARRFAPIAAFLTLLTPTVVRFAGTEYVDIFVGSLLVSSLFFALRWMREPEWGTAALAGAGLGLAAGAKVLGVAYALALAGAAIPLARGRWGRRLPQLAVAALCAALLGSFFYLRNVRLGTDPLALACERTASGKENANVPTIPRKNSVLDLPQTMFGQGQFVQAFLGTTRPHSLELGVGPAALVLLLAACMVPFGFGREGWRAAAVVAAQIWAELAFWVSVPFARNFHVFANVRYLIPGIALAFAAAAALAERRRLDARWVEALGWVLGIQALLQLHAEMPYEVRVAMAWLDLALVALAVSPALRAWTAARAGRLVTLGIAMAVFCAPLLGSFRTHDRPRALATEFTAHMTSARFFASGWSWLDAHAGTGTVAVVGSPNSYFVYPAMGLRLEREVRYVNFNRTDLHLAHRYPECEPRIDPEPAAWIDNLTRERVRWVLLDRYPQFDFSIEDGWAAARPDLFVLRYADLTNRIYEFLPLANRP